MSEAWDVLVIEDEPVVREAIRRVLGTAGLRVATARDGASALRDIGGEECRLVICDLMLPDMPGIDVLRALRRVRPALPVLLITGYATPDNVAQALEAGATGFLPKPFDEPELLSIVRRVLGGEDVREEKPS